MSPRSKSGHKIRYLLVLVVWSYFDQMSLVIFPSE